MDVRCTRVCPFYLKMFSMRLSLYFSFLVMASPTVREAWRDFEECATINEADGAVTEARNESETVAEMWDEFARIGEKTPEHPPHFHDGPLPVVKVKDVRFPEEDAKAHRLPATAFRPWDTACGTVFLADFSYSQNFEWLARNNVTAVVNLAASDGKPNAFPQQLAYWSIALKDADEELNNLLLFFTLQTALAFIDGVIARGQSVLVHCVEGKSRSPTIVIAYLMFRKSMTLREAHTMVLGARTSIQPNHGFMRQLIAFERLYNYGVATMDVKDYPPPICL